uniref:Polyprotein n=1 Tax=Peronospora matthiolae TaxID=2874970 RepID=A0AAV1VPF8_9STRA
MNVDNQAAISVAEHAGYKSRAKHIDLHYHFVRDAIQDNVLKIKYVPTTQQLADFMTKSLPTPQFLKLVKLGGIVDDPETST